MTATELSWHFEPMSWWLLCDINAGQQNLCHLKNPEGPLATLGILPAQGQFVYVPKSIYLRILNFKISNFPHMTDHCRQV